MKSHQKQASVVQSIDAFLAQVNASTQRLKTAESRAEAGGYEGETTHPVKNVDDRLETAPEGARAKENEKDVREDVEINVNKGDGPIASGENGPSHGLGLEQGSTGTPPNTSSAKGGKEDASEGDKGPQGRGETSHPARTDNESLQGGKYASAHNLLGLIKAAEDPGRDLVARIAVEANGMLQQQAQKLAHDGACGGKPKVGKDGKPEEVSPKEAAAAGADLASILAAAPEAEKQAVEQEVVRSIAYTIQDARNRAIKTAQFLDQLFTEVNQKQAGEEGPPPPHHGDGGGSDADGGEGAGGPPAPGAVPGAEGAAQGMGPSGGGGDEEALIQALLGGGQGGGGAGGPGGMPGGPGGGAEMGGMGGGMGGGEGGMPQLSPEDIEMLKHILSQVDNGQGGKGMPPEAMEAKAAAQAFHIIAQQQKQAGAAQPTWRPKNAAEAQRYQAIAKYVNELVNA